MDANEIQPDDLDDNNDYFFMNELLLVCKALCSGQLT